MMQIGTNSDLLKRLKKPLLGVLIFFAFYTVVGFFVLPAILKTVLVKNLSERLGREVAIERIRFNPYVLSATVSGLTIKEADASDVFVTFEELYVNVQVLSVLKRGLVAKKIKLSGPYLHLIRTKERRYNFSDLVNEETKKEDQSETVIPKFSIENIDISGGRVVVSDLLEETTHEINDIRVVIPFISSFDRFADTWVEPSVSASLNGVPVRITAKSIPFSISRESILDVEINDLDMPRYLCYLPVKLHQKMLSGYLDLATRIIYSQKSEGPPSLEVSGDVVLRAIEAVTFDEQELLKVPELKIGVSSFEPITKKLHLSEISLKPLELNLWRNRDGTINYHPALLYEIAEEVRPEERKDATALSVQIDNIKATGAKILFSDFSTEEPFQVTLTSLDLSVTHFSTSPNSKARFSLSARTDKDELVDIEGMMSIDPLSADLKLTLEDMDIRPVRHYIPEKIKIQLTGGKVAAGGNLLLGYEEKHGLTVTYLGEASISDFSTIDKIKENRLIMWKAFDMEGIDAGNKPSHLHIRKTGIRDLYASLQISPEGSLNILEVLTGEDKERHSALPAERQISDSGKEESPAIDVKIAEILLQGGHIDFADNHIKPTFNAPLSDIEGSIRGLSSEEGTQADVNLHGKLAGGSPLEIQGKISPLGEELFADLRLTFKGVDLTRVNPYARKYVGYTIEKGNLEFDLEYLIVKKKLDSKNNLLFDQLTLGDKVDSPDATTLPVKFAISLLKNRKGQIELNLPVRGEIDDPEFDPGKVIFKALRNFLTKVIASPFGFLGSMFGGGEDLSYLEFDYGSSKISEQAAAKLDTLVTALYERPNLKLEIEGYVDPDKDSEALRLDLFSTKIKAQKHREMLKRGKSEITADQVIVSPDEYEKYLRLAYTEEFSKEGDKIASPDDLPTAELEKRLLSKIEISDDDLAALAQNRSLSAKTYILDSGKVEAGRIFQVRPRSLSPQAKEGVKASRVIMKIK